MSLMLRSDKMLLPAPGEDVQFGCRNDDGLLDLCAWRGMRLRVEAEGVPKEGSEPGDDLGCEVQSSDSESSHGSAMFPLMKRYSSRCFRR